MNHIGHLAHKATLPTQGSSENAETKKQKQNRSQTKEMEGNKQLDIEFKTTVIRFFKNFLKKADTFNKTLENRKGTN